MKTPKEWIQECHEKPFLFDSENDLFIRKVQADAMNYAAELVHSMSRGTHSEERVIAIDEARDMILEEAIGMVADDARECDAKIHN